jgi:hypothetical protein
MSKRYYNGDSQREMATLSYFPGWEIRNNSRSERINQILVPALLPVVKKKNKNINDVPITF